MKKPPSKVAQKNSNPLFPLLPAQPKWPKQKNSCSKMWPIDQLYIELGSNPNLDQEPKSAKLTSKRSSNEKVSTAMTAAEWVWNQRKSFLTTFLTLAIFHENDKETKNYISKTQEFKSYLGTLLLLYTWYHYNFLARVESRSSTKHRCYISNVCNVPERVEQSRI